MMWRVLGWIALVLEHALVLMLGLLALPRQLMQRQGQRWRGQS